MVVGQREDALSDALARELGGTITGLRRLSGGASRETWSFDRDDRPLILQRDRPGVVRNGAGMAAEAALLKAAAGEGVPVPAVVHDGGSDGPDGPLGAPFVVVDRLDGETIARKLLRDDEYAAVRPRLASEYGRILAGIHRIDPDDVPGLTTGDQLQQQRDVLDLIGEPHPAFELALRWLDSNRPSAGAPTVVHGDFRTGNILITPDGVGAVLDWELAHLGDPLEDLGWVCVRAWRFGSEHPVGGFGEREAMYEAYEAAGGRHVDRDAARWWEVLGTLKWGVICMVQAASHRSGMSRSVELAAIGRRTCENEHDVLALLPGGPMPPATVAEPGSGGFAPHDLPSAAELAEAVREWVEGDVSDATEGRVRFHARVAANVLGMLERELHVGPSHAAAHEARLAGLGFASDAALATAIRGGEQDDRWDEVRDAVWASVRDKVAVANPGYDADRA